MYVSLDQTHFLLSIIGSAFSLALSPSPYFPIIPSSPSSFAINLSASNTAIHPLPTLKSESVPGTVTKYTHLDRSGVGCGKIAVAGL
ncbi:hypothetical protein K435DRAFT_851936 [Dendrothele bispora CBS 962.96]|uniref:Uncharacterized protein n=1 Tax=Dendrothele bispora (strain CBS 962.96) TaxID=1314807 RepID=A0A4S8MKX4_DENBC|nr:hypothetical protein K435DRAFT_851936 [Dendrothele bispora CBS 962.96]